MMIINFITKNRIPLDKIIVRLSDNSIYEASSPDDYTMAHALRDLMASNPSWYFRKITEIPKKWWQRKKRYKRTGEIWEPKKGEEFKAIFNP